MKLYYSPGACSLAVHIVLHEADIAFELIRVNLKTKLTETGIPLNKIHSKNYVPILEISNGIFITEVVVIMQYLADLKPLTQMAPDSGMNRIRLQEWLSFISSEIHKGFYPLFHPSPEQYQISAREKLTHNFSWINDQLGNKKHLMGEQFTIADCYLFTILRWCRAVKIEISSMPALVDFFERIKRRPSVQASLAEEGLISDVLS